MDNDMMLVQLAISLLALAIGIVLLIIVLVLWKQLKAMRKRYSEMMNGSGVANLQDVIIDIQQRLSEQQERGMKTNQALQSITDKVSGMKGNLAIIRYNAFNDKGQGSDLSFSVAILDDAKSGAVLTGIFGRDESFMYGKPIKQGESQYPLTPEEKEVIRIAGTSGTIENTKKDSK